jgi:hypothetical protein
MDETMRTEGRQHAFRESDDDELRCRWCGGYPFDLLHWCTG